ncbi:MAG TPA: rhomboid family intramembrane serine protease [Methylomirabilota bacterium]|jgi:membrane associated rhomboid family serine protease|nr:rhomboid family intramembrane serine protease [Methylomirabilota bacterium]
MADEPQQRLAEGQRLLDGGDLDAAVQILAPLAGHPDPELSGAALLAIGSARYRLDDEAGAKQAWRAAAERGGSQAWLGWRSVAEQEVRDGNLEEAVTAYREADRRAPSEERGAIANRIAWLLKETGHDFAARRQFNRARGSYGSYPALVTWAIVAANVIVFAADGLLSGSGSPISGGSGPLSNAGAVYGPAVANGEWWRLITGAFLHLGLLHILFNMYALWLFGPIMEQMYGHVEYAVIYLLCALGGNVLTILAAPDTPALGASGAIFGLFGLAFVVSRRRHLLLGPQARAMLSRVGTLLVLNLFITFSVPNISWTGHIGGLAVGAVIGLLLAPANVPTLGGMWRAPDGSPLARRVSPALRASTYLLVAAALVFGTYVAIQQLG